MVKISRQDSGYLGAIPGCAFERHGEQRHVTQCPLTVPLYKMRIILFLTMTQVSKVPIILWPMELSSGSQSSTQV